MFSKIFKFFKNINQCRLDIANPYERAVMKARHARERGTFHPWPIEKIAARYAARQTAYGMIDYARSIGVTKDQLDKLLKRAEYLAPDCGNTDL